MSTIDANKWSPIISNEIAKLRAEIAKAEADLGFLRVQLQSLLGAANFIQIATEKPAPAAPSEPTSEPAETPAT